MFCLSRREVAWGRGATAHPRAGTQAAIASDQNEMAKKSREQVPGRGRTLAGQAGFASSVLTYMTRSARSHLVNNTPYDAASGCAEELGPPC